MSNPYAEVDRYWKTRPYGIGRRPHFRLEDLPSEVANEPSGRGAKTAAGRGYDAERVLERVIDGAEIDHKSYRDAIVRDKNSRWASPWHHVPIEAKSCVTWYPSGAPGTFRIWKRNHEKLVSPLEAYYFLLIYKVDQWGTAYEVGKLMSSVETIDSIIDENWTNYSNDYGVKKKYIDLPWTRVLSVLGVSNDLLREWELVYA